MIIINLHDISGPVELVLENLLLLAELVKVRVDALQTPVDELARLFGRLLNEPVVAEQHQKLVRVHELARHEGHFANGHHDIVA